MIVNIMFRLVFIVFVDICSHEGMYNYVRICDRAGPKNYETLFNITFHSLVRLDRIQ
jgi:hypothetical protein